MNDLIGLEYRWGANPNDGSGKTDCFQLVCEIRSRLGLSDYSEKYSWAYWLYDEKSLPPKRMARWLLHSGTRIKIPRVGAVALLADPNNAALGTVTDQGLICIAPGGRVVCIPVGRVAAHYFWVD
jgi:hypothetical protein